MQRILWKLHRELPLDACWWKWSLHLANKELFSKCDGNYREIKPKWSSMLDHILFSCRTRGSHKTINPKAFEMRSHLEILKMMKLPMKSLSFMTSPAKRVSLISPKEGKTQHLWRSKFAQNLIRGPAIRRIFKLGWLPKPSHEHRVMWISLNYHS